MKKILCVALWGMVALLSVANAHAVVQFHGTYSLGAALYPDASLSSVSAECAWKWGSGAMAEGSPTYVLSTVNGLPSGWSQCGKWVNSTWTRLDAGVRVYGVEVAASDCPADGTEFQLQVPRGWDTTPNPADGSAVAYPASAPSSYCLQTAGKFCSYNDQGSVKDASGFMSCITDAEPGETGLYRTTCRHTFKSAGVTCTPSSSNDETALNPAPPPCEGYLGSINGKQTCLPTMNPPTPYTPAAGTPKTQQEAHTPLSTAGGRAPSTTNPPADGAPGGGGTGGSDGSGKSGMGRGAGKGGNTLEGSAAGPVSGGGGTTMPTDYNREATQQQIRDLLKTDGGAAMADQSVLVRDASKKGTDDLSTMRTNTENGVPADKDRFFSWVWTTPAVSCAPFAGQVGPYAISWDLCPTIENIRSVLNWLFALFAAVEVYGQLFRRNDA